MNRKSILVLALALCTVALSLPASAAGFSAYGSYWDVSDLDSTAGGGVKFSIPMGQVLNFDIRGTYYEQIEDDGFFDRLDDNDEAAFNVRNAVDIIPIDVGISANLAQRGAVTPYIGGGVSYFLLDTDRGEIDDEVGYYANVGIEFANRGNWGFFVEALYRSATGTVESSPEDFDELDEIDGIDFDRTEIDLDGLGANAGIVWRW